MDIQDRQDDELVRQLFCTTRIFSRTLNGCVAPLGLHSSEWMVLNFIHLNDGIAQAELIRYFKVEAAAITRTLSRLEKKGLIDRVYNQEDRRSVSIHLREEGRSLWSQVDRVIDEANAKITNGLDPEHYAQFLSALSMIERNTIAE